MLTIIERLATSEELSLTEVSVNRLCREAGISRNTFYSHWDDKGDLLLELADEIFQTLDERARGFWSAPEKMSLDDMAALAKVVFEQYRAHQPVLLAVADTAVYDPVVRERYTALIDGFASNVREALEKQTGGPAAAAIPARETGEMLAWMLERTCYTALRSADADKIDALSRATAWIVASAMRRATPDAP